MSEISSPNQSRMIAPESELEHPSLASQNLASNPAWPRLAGLASGLVVAYGVQEWQPVKTYMYPTADSDREIQAQINSDTAYISQLVSAKRTLEGVSDLSTQPFDAEIISTTTEVQGLKEDLPYGYNPNNETYSTSASIIIPALLVGAGVHKAVKRRLSKKEPNKN